MKHLLVLFLLSAFSFSLFAQQEDKSATPDYTLVKRNVKDSIHIDTSKIYQGKTLIGKMTWGEAHTTVVGLGRVVTKTMGVSLPNKTKVADAYTETNGDPYVWHITTTKDQQRTKITARKEHDKEDVLWYLINGGYL